MKSYIPWESLSEKSPPKWGSIFKKMPPILVRALTLGWEVAVATLAPLLAGLWADRHLENAVPWFTLAGVGIGVFLGMAIVLLDTKRAIEEIEERHRSEEETHREKG